MVLFSELFGVWRRLTNACNPLNARLGSLNSLRVVYIQLSRYTEIADCVTIFFNAFPRFDYCHAALNSRNHVCLFSILFRDLTASSLH
jgi:hypothetical protein